MTPHHPEGGPSGAPRSRPHDGVPAPGRDASTSFVAPTGRRRTLGPVEAWPANLRMLVDVCLSSRFPMLVCWGPDLSMLYNDGYRDLLGESKHPGAWGRPIREVWPEIWDVIGPMLHGVASGGPATWVEDELLVVDRYGFLEEAYFTWSFGAVHDDDGQVAGVLDIATETTAKVLAERRDEMSARLVASLADAETREDVRDRALEVLGSQVNDHLASAIRWHGEGDEPQSGAVDGHVVHVVPVVEPGLLEPSAYLLLTENPRRPWDAPLQVYAELCASHVAMALSGIRRLQDERHRSEALADLDVAKSDFFANVSHELRTPLTLIAGPVQDALASGGLDPEQRQRFELIRRNTDRLAGLVDRILDLTRVEAGAVEPHWVPADVEELTTGIAANFRPAIERMGLEFEVVCDDLDHEAYVDVDMFERIVLNLLSNALKFTARGRISLRLTGDGDGYAVSVTDTGIGIAEKDLDLVFDRFRQLDRGDDRRSREGAGIGLSLVRQLVDLLGGRVAVRSQPGHGQHVHGVAPVGPRGRACRVASLDPAALGRVLHQRGEQLGHPRRGRGRDGVGHRRGGAPARPGLADPAGPTRCVRRCSSSRTTTTCATTSPATASSTTTSSRFATAWRPSTISAPGARRSSSPTS